MVTFEIIHTQDSAYEFVENLLETSFPQNERRDNLEQRVYTDYNSKFSCYLIKNESAQPIGVITIWKLNGFYYVEHLATSPSVRNKGYGKEIMSYLTDMLKEVIILEVERPEDELSRRRIGFYQRCGFSLCNKNYIQPAYRKGGEEVPLFLMYTHTTSIDHCFEEIRDNIYKEVYGVNR